jgi:regulator of cell morphogenesis and NO signaling
MNRDQGDLTSIVKSILMPHHSLLRRDMERVVEVSARVVVEQRPPLCRTLLPLFRLFREFQRELDDYLNLQEESLFPRVLDLEASSQFGFGMPEAAGAVSEGLRLLMYGQSLLTAELEEMRELTQGFTAPADACKCYAELMDAMAALALHVETKLHMERNLLIPQAGALLDRAGQMPTDFPGNISFA